MKKQYTKPIKSIKVYEVTFGMFESKEEYLNVTSYTVLGENVEEAIASSKGYLSTKQEKTHFVQEVKLITCID